MKQFRTIALLLALPICAAEEQATPAPRPQAGEHGPSPYHAQLPKKPQLFRQASREQIALRMMVRQLLLNRYDADGDQELDEEEQHRLMADAHAARKQQALAFIRRFDADGDGKLNPEEREAMEQEMENRRRPGKTSSPQAGRPQGTSPEGTAEAPQHPAPPRHHAGNRAHDERPHGHRPPHPRMGKRGQTVALLIQKLTMDAYDADKDGILDTEESAHLREDGAKLYQAREAELLTLYDADKDGRLSQEELSAAMGELMPRPPLHVHGAPPPPQPGHGRRPGPRRGPLNRLLDPHFDIDILLNLARPQAADCPAPICSPSTPSAS